MKIQTKAFSCFLFIILYLACSCSTQKSTNIKYTIDDTELINIHVKGKGYEGVIFPKEHDDIPFNYNWIKDIKDKITLTPTEIEYAEKILRKGIKEISKNSYYPNHPIIHKKLSKYARQYFGYINTNGDKIVFVNCFWQYDDSQFARFIHRTLYNEVPDERWETEYNNIFDGGSYYWQIKINLTKDILFDFSVNGIA